MFEKLQNDMKEALKNHDKVKLDTIRMSIAAIKQAHIDDKVEINDDLVIKVISKEIKTRNDSIKEFSNANREDLIDKTQKEIDILKEYMPKQLEEDEIRQIIEVAIKSVDATSIKDMGKVMKEVTPKLSGKADMSNVSKIVKEMLGAI